MSNLAHKPTPGNPCPESCQICDERYAADLAAHLGLADDDSDARAADAVRWALFSPDMPRVYDDRENPGKRESAGPPSMRDAEWWAAESFYEGCGEDELSPEEEFLEVFGEPSFERACRLHAEMMEEEAQEAEYHRLLSVLSDFGGFSADY